MKSCLNIWTENNSCMEWINISKKIFFLNPKLWKTLYIHLGINIRKCNPLSEYALYVSKGLRTINQTTCDQDQYLYVVIMFAVCQKPLMIKLSQTAYSKMSKYSLKSFLGKEKTGKRLLNHFMSWTDEIEKLDWNCTLRITWRPLLPHVCLHIYSPPDFYEIVQQAQKWQPRVFTCALRVFGFKIELACWTTPKSFRFIFLPMFLSAGTAPYA